ncbi:MAG: NAD(P)-dependent glycerol-1-phosphate dehydrogenase [Candidatus Thermoplasmatota archaeon]|nr:NAD(P)-dependent glycerol-1-phosphate dehydrogenase [Candidatus Thermoplasmatota archaeon]
MFEKDKMMIFPRMVSVGHGVIADVGKICSELGLSGTGLVITGGTTSDLAGNTVAEVIKAEGFGAVMHITGSATLESVELAVDAGKKAKAGFVLGVGGGSKIDVAKLVATELKKPFISIPTSAAHDGIASPRASIKNDIGSVSREAVSPLGIIADTGIIMKSPYRLLASGCGDALSNLTAVKDWELAKKLRNEEYSSFAAVLSKTAAQIILDSAGSIKPGIEESVWLVAKALIVSGVSMSIANSSRPTSGAEHMFSHALDKIANAPALHGEQVGVGTIMMMYLHGGDWMKIKEALKRIGAPTTAKDLGVTDEQIVRALMMAHEIRKDRYTILGEGGLTKEAAENLAHITGVIS